MAEVVTDSRDHHGSVPELKRVMGPGLLLLFIVGDILGAGIYAITGEVAGEVGGVVWLPFLVAFGVATLTALSYLELVTHFPQAAGAALYTHKAFGIHFVTFLVAFAVICSGITWFCWYSSTSSGIIHMPSVRPVRTRPGPTAFTRMRRGPSSIAATWASMAAPAFEAQ